LGDNKKNIIFAPVIDKSYNNIYTYMDKTKVSQDFLFNFITERGINVSTLASLMGLSTTMVNGCFRHNKDKNGNPRNFPIRSIARLNTAIEELSNQLRSCLITFGSDSVYTNKRGAIYDPGTIDSIKLLHKYFKLSKFLKYALGWSESKKSIVLNIPSSKGYGCVTADDVERINAAITEVIIVFNNIEVMADVSRIDQPQVVR